MSKLSLPGLDSCYLAAVGVVDYDSQSVSCFKFQFQLANIAMSIFSHVLIAVLTQNLRQSCCYGRSAYFCPVISSSFFLSFFLVGMSTILPHMMWP